MPPFCRHFGDAARIRHMPICRPGGARCCCATSSSAYGKWANIALPVLIFRLRQLFNISLTAYRRKGFLGVRQRHAAQPSVISLNIMNADKAADMQRGALRRRRHRAAVDMSLVKISWMRAYFLLASARFQARCAMLPTTRDLVLRHALRGASISYDGARQLIIARVAPTFTIITTLHDDAGQCLLFAIPPHFYF